VLLRGMSMNWPVTISRALPLLAVLFASAAPAETAGQPARPIVDCRSAATSFERSAGLPSGLLLAIGQIESGRTDPVTNRTDPWPWATNHAGEGHYFASAQEAIAWVTAQQAIGIRSIDVGCFQVNLHYHPDAFADLTEAFDPAANARYAAALLNRLHEQGGSWPLAIALYHSADPVEGQRYSARVMQVWDTGGSFAGISTSEVVRSVASVAVRLSAAASVVRVIVPNWAAAGPTMPLSGQRAGLPRVFVPSR
jgi:hypothetical protein